MTTVFPAIPGWDVSGVVERVGLDTPEFQPGDEVIAYARKDFVQGELRGLRHRARARRGAQALALDWDQAAGLPLAGLTAYQLLSRLGLGQGETVLMHRRRRGGSPGRADRPCHRRPRHRYRLGGQPRGAAWFGVEPVAYGEGLADRVRELALDGVDVVVDFIGGVLDTTLAVLKDGGRHGSIVDGEVAEHGGLYAWVRPSADDLQTLSDLADQGLLTVPVAQVFHSRRRPRRSA